MRRNSVLLVAAVVLGCAPGLMAQAPGGFSGFTQGNLVVPRNVYTRDATVAKGQLLPSVSPIGAACAGNGGRLLHVR
jgi:hypothetical protein